MNYRKILIGIAACIFACETGFSQIVFTEQEKQSISKGLNDFATELMYVIPETSTQQNVWADAFIGKVFPAFPPHFGGGITIGGTLLNAEGVKLAADTMMTKVKSITDDFQENVQSLGLSKINNIDYSNMFDIGKLPSKIFIPTATVDLRIGGLFLPFDIGVCAMMTNPNLTDIDLSNPSSILSANGNLKFGGSKYNGTIDYLTVGGDLRYAILEGDLILPKISIGAGYYYTTGSIGFNAKSEKQTNFTDSLGGNTKQITTAGINIAYNTQTAFVQLEVSKKILFMTIFGGARGIVSSSTNSWSWDFDTHNTNENEEVAKLFKAAASDSGTVSSGNGITDVYKKGKWDFSNIQPQVYAGVGFNFLCLQTTIGACADISSLYRTDKTDFIWSAFFSFRAKL